MAQVIEAAEPRPLGEAVGLGPAISVETAIYLAAGALAAFFRLARLGEAPLTPDESGLAFSSWAIVHEIAPLAWAAPAYQTVTGLLIWLFGSDDAIPRLTAALAGIALVGLVWWLRPLIGRPAALIAAGLLAVSPLAVYFSRQVSGHTLALLAGVGLLGLLFRLKPEPGPLAAGLIGGLGAVLLLAGPVGISLALSLAIFLAIASLARDRFGAIWQPLEAMGRNRPTLIAAVAAFGLTFVFLTTGAFGYWRGFGLPSLAAWITGFDLSGLGLPWWYQWAQLVVAEPATTLFGVIGLLATLRRLPVLWRQAGDSADLFSLWLVVWALSGLVLAGLAPAPGSGQVLVALVPLALLAGRWLGGGLGQRGESILDWSAAAWGRSIWSIAVGPLFFFELILLTRATGESSGNGPLWSLFWAGLLLLLAVAVAPIFLDPADGRRISATLGLLLLLVPTLAMAFRLGPRLSLTELPVQTRTAPDLKRLLADVTIAAGQPESGQARPIAVDGRLAQPLAWYLKRYPNVFFGDLADSAAAIQIRPAEGGSNAPPAGAARTVMLTESWQPSFPDGAALARWLVLDRVPPSSTRSQKVNLYVNP